MSAAIDGMWGVSYLRVAAQGQAVEGVLWMNGDGSSCCTSAEQLWMVTSGWTDRSNGAIGPDRNPDASDSGVGLGCIKLVDDAADRDRLRAVLKVWLVGRLRACVIS